jgi:hypothetical protein
LVNEIKVNVLRSSYLDSNVALAEVYHASYVQLMVQLPFFNISDFVEYLFVKLDLS